jgi:6-phosphogluconolactonase/glucosamine-6-phosphate isomerase/deaminase
MVSMHIVPASDEEHVHRKLVTLLLAAVVEKPDLVVSVFAGTPAFGLYRLLTERAAAEEVDFGGVRFVVFDELAGASGGSFRAVLQERLFGPLGVTAARIVAFDPAADPSARGSTSPGSTSRCSRSTRAATSASMPRARLSIRPRAS